MRSDRPIGKSDVLQFGPHESGVRYSFCNSQHAGRIGEPRDLLTPPSSTPPHLLSDLLPSDQLPFQRLPPLSSSPRHRAIPDLLPFQHLPPLSSSPRHRAIPVQLPFQHLPPLSSSPRHRAIHDLEACSHAIPVRSSSSRFIPVRSSSRSRTTPDPFPLHSIACQSSSPPFQHLPPSPFSSIHGSDLKARQSSSSPFQQLPPSPLSSIHASDLKARQSSSSPPVVSPLAAHPTDHPASPSVHWTYWSKVGTSEMSTSSARTRFHGSKSFVCSCGLPAVLLTSHTTLNPGRRFLRCPQFRDASLACKFFRWVDDCHSSKREVLSNTDIEADSRSQSEVTATNQDQIVVDMGELIHCVDDLRERHMTDIRQLKQIIETNDLVMKEANERRDKRVFELANNVKRNETLLITLCGLVLVIVIYLAL